MLSQETRDAANLAYFLDALVVVESGEGKPARVAVLLGAAQSTPAVASCVQPVAVAT